MRDTLLRSFPFYRSIPRLSTKDKQIFLCNMPVCVPKTFTKGTGFVVKYEQKRKLLQKGNIANRSSSCQFSQR